jgi:IPT/TIG domain
LSRVFPSGRCAAFALVTLVLCGCSGGNDEASRQIELSTSSLAFTAASPLVATPAAQIITVSLGEGATNVTALQSGSAIASVAVSVEGRSARVTVTPVTPALLGAGHFTGSVAISAYYCADTACSRLEAGPARTASVAYRISPIVTDVAPSAAMAATTASVVIRGGGFTAFPPQTVNFGATPATSITIVSDTEIRATYPALAAGTYPITLSATTHPEPISSEAQLVVVDPLAFPAQVLAWPVAPTRVHSIEYDTRRRAVFAATDAAGGQLVRFAHTDGAWQTASVGIAALRDAALTTDGQQLLTISDGSATVVNPDNLAAGAAIPAPSLPTGSYLSTLAFLNTNQALITTAVGTYTASPLYSFVTRTGSLTQQTSQFFNGAIQGAKNQTLLALTQVDPTAATTSYVYLASAATNALTASSITLNQNSVPAALDRDASRIALNGSTVYDGGAVLLGTLPTTTAAVALSPDGKIAYTYDTSASALLKFDISTAVDAGGAFTAVGAPVPLFASPGSGLAMLVSDDGSTLFIAGAGQLVIQPVP